MDKQIKKAKKSLDKGEKDIKLLQRMDKKFDGRLVKCDMKLKNKRK